jgi:hypothetical protein
MCVMRTFIDSLSGDRNPRVLELLHLGDRVPLVVLRVRPLHRRVADCAPFNRAGSEPSRIARDPDRVESISRPELSDRVRQVVPHGRRRKIQVLADLLGR